MAALSAEDIRSLGCFILKDVQENRDVQLGEGAYGRVYEVTYLETSCAAKEIHEIFFRTAKPEDLEKIKENFLKECSIWNRLRGHQNIVTLFGVYFRSSNNTGIPVMVMEKMQYSLRSLIERQEVVVEVHLKLAILHDVSLGLRYLHEQHPPIIHRDLTPNNILVNFQVNHSVDAKISDLGVSKVIQDTNSNRKMTKIPGTRDFMPPETFDDNPQYNTAVDIFSYAGVMLYTIVEQWPTPTAREKYNQDTRKREVVLEVERRQKYLNCTWKLVEGLKPLVKLCLDDDPEYRPAIQEVSARIGDLMKTDGTHDMIPPASLTTDCLSLQVSLLRNK